MQDNEQNNLNDTHPLILFPEDEDVCDQINQQFPNRKRAFTQDQKILIEKFSKQILKKFSQPGQFKQTEQLKGQAVPFQQNSLQQKFQPQQKVNVQNTQRYYQSRTHGYVFQKARTKQTVSYNNYQPYQQQNIQQYQNKVSYNNQNPQQQRYKRPTYVKYYKHYDPSRIEYPDKTKFNYKPSYYNYYQNQQGYNNQKSSWSDWYKNFIDKYGIKIRKVDINDINKKINNNKNINNQYWNNRRKNFDNQQNDADNFNKVIHKDDSKPKPEIKIPDGQKKDDDQGKVFISGLISNVIDKKQKEEMDDNDSDNNVNDNNKKQIISNSLINTFKNVLVKNEIDDLQDLLKTSKKYEAAKNLVSNGKYTDPDFPPNEYSIYGFGDRQDYSLEDLRSLPWQRPEVFFEGMPITVYKTLDSNDIEQGGLGDCYFLAAISAIAEYPARLERIFLTKEYQPNGIYVLALCINGIWQDVVLDDMVPCTKYTKKPAFNRSKSQELWVILLEKAWAKVHGGYMNIAAGLTREALRDLTGASAITYFTSQEPEALWERLVQADHNKFVMTAGSDNLNNGSDAYIEKIGIAGSHAYSLLAVFELQQNGQDYQIVHPEDNKEGMRIGRLVQLRNPWGKGEWKGDWCDDSYKWTSKLKRELNYINADDGVFFMTYNDFIKYYSDVQICYYHDDYKYSAISLQSDSKVPDFIQFELSQPGKFYFSLNQKNRRFFPRKKNYSYSNCTFLLAHISEDGTYDYIGGAMKADKENWIGEEVQAGKYIAMLKTPWKSFVNEFSFSIYGPQVTEITELQTHELPDNFITKLMVSHFKEYPHDLVQNFAQQGHPEITYTTFDNKGGFGYIAFQNQSKDTILQATVEMLGSVNVEMVEPFQGLKPSVEVSPGQIEVIPYYATKLPYTTQMRLLTTFKNPNFSQNIKEQVRKSSTVLSKNMNGQPVDIKVYVLYHSEGLAMLYVNNTSQHTINEEIEFDMQSCHIDGTYGNYVEVCVKPGQERLLQIIKDEGAQNYNAKITKLYYKIV